jgi:hypothetical protein
MKSSTILSNKLSIVNIFLVIHSNRYRAILGELVFIDFCNLIHCILMEFYQVAILLIIINSKIYYAQNLKINYLLNWSNMIIWSCDVNCTIKQ